MACWTDTITAAMARTKLILEPSVLVWARRRARLEPDELAAKIGVQTNTLQRWEEKGEISPVQVRKPADKTYTSFGYLFLRHPPEDRIPLADFRSREHRQHHQPSIELLDTIANMQRRQDWLHEELIRLGASPYGLVGSFDVGRYDPGSCRRFAQASRSCTRLGRNIIDMERSTAHAHRCNRSRRSFCGRERRGGQQHLPATSPSGISRFRAR